MNHTSFRQSLVGLGLANAQAAGLLGVSRRSVERWVAGHQRVPRMVALAVMMLERMDLRERERFLKMEGVT